MPQKWTRNTQWWKVARRLEREHLKTLASLVAKEMCWPALLSRDLITSRKLSPLQLPCPVQMKHTISYLHSKAHLLPLPILSYFPVLPGVSFPSSKAWALLLRAPATPDTAFCLFVVGYVFRQNWLVFIFLVCGLGSRMLTNHVKEWPNARQEGQCMSVPSLSSPLLSLPPGCAFFIPPAVLREITAFNWQDLRSGISSTESSSVQSCNLVKLLFGKQQIGTQPSQKTTPGPDLQIWEKPPQGDHFVHVINVERLIVLLWLMIKSESSLTSRGENIYKIYHLLQYHYLS